MNRKAAMGGLRAHLSRTIQLVKGESRESHRNKVSQVFRDAILAGPKPHQGYKECARRVEQLKAGRISNYIHGGQYQGLWW